MEPKSALRINSFSILTAELLHFTITIVILLCAARPGLGQSDSLAAGTTSGKYCSPRVVNQNPAKLAWAGLEYQGAFDIEYGALDSIINTAGIGQIKSSHAIRVGTSLPIIVRESIIWQLGFNYARTTFNGGNTPEVNALDATLKSNGLTTAGLTTGLFKPLNAKTFLIGQASADLNGDYSIDNFIPLKYLRYSAAVIVGKKYNERKMIGLGLSRTYRAGQLNYIPVILLNWTSPTQNWGVEILAPARANFRRKISEKSNLLIGYEMEGNSYRVLMNHSANPLGYELRRGEIRLRAIWETSIQRFVRLSLQAGYRIGNSFNLDNFAPTDKEIFRGFFGDQPYAQENALKGTWYAQVSVNLVSP